MFTLNRLTLVAALLIAITAPTAAAATPLAKDAKVLYLHHSTGQCVWEGGVPGLIAAANSAGRTRYTITEQAFPKDQPYGWNNYPYDYWNIWVKHAGDRPFKGEPTLEMLTRRYNVIVWKHCFPVTNVEADTGRANVGDQTKRGENYRAQYLALRTKMRQFPKTRFLVWTGAVALRGDMDAPAAARARAFFQWVKNTWDTPGDNIYVWDFYELQTEGGNFLKPAYAEGTQDSHPNAAFCRKVAPMFCGRLLDVIAGRGDSKDITGAIAARKLRKLKPTEPNAPKPEPQPTAKAPAAPAVVPPAKGALVFENAEDPKRAPLWGTCGKYVADGDGRAVAIAFATGKAEDWGEYGRQRIVATTPPARNIDLRAYRYMAMRVRVDRKMELVTTLVTRPETLPKTSESYFAFTAYVHPAPGQWRTVVIDLAKLELNCEGDAAYNAAGKPNRPMHLTSLKLVTNEKNAAAQVLLDDVTFYGTLPVALKPFVLQP